MKAKIIQIESIKSRHHKGGINDLLERAQILKTGLKNNYKLIFNNQDLSQFFEGVISKILLNARILSEDCFLCGIYISRLLSSVAIKTPKSWYAVDYFLEGCETNNPFIIKEGADICFILFSLFKPRTNRRILTPRDYRDMGQNLYCLYSSVTNETIGNKMSQNFELMAGVTEEAIASLKI